MTMSGGSGSHGLMPERSGPTLLNSRRSHMTQTTHIHFVLPFRGRKPVGGFKVVYEYANQFASMGYQVTITHAAGLYLGVHPNDRALTNIAKFIIFGAARLYRPDPWFNLEPSVKTRWVPSLHSVHSIPAEIVIATAWETAEWIARWPISAGSKHYLIQHLEDWIAPRERVLETWRLPLKKVVISKWLEAIALNLGETTTYIPNGLDHKAFGLDIPIESRNPLKVLMLYHPLAFKGTHYGLEAIKIAREQYPNLELTLFGVEEPPKNSLPDGVLFERKPSQLRLRALYNQSSIFLSPSLAEGWALPPAEAMMCGCATVLTQIGGHEYAINGSTSLLSEPHDANAMAQNLKRLIEDHDQRLRLARGGLEAMKQYDWATAAKAMEKTFN
ncbi:MAG: glycosyltransferase [Gammaproteobacteria bacterium]|nr:glycosyltransferase [Gammaproteobacteria bacterium]